MIKVLTILSVILIVNAIEFELDEASKQLRKEIEKIGATVIKLNYTQCLNKKALTQLDYNNTASPLTATFRKQCLVDLIDQKFNNDCQRDDMFVNCLMMTMGKKIAEMEDKCAEKYNTTLKAYIKATEEEKIKNQDLACFRTCFLRGVEYIKEDGTFRELEDIATHYSNFKCNVTQIAVECIQLGDKEVTECSKSVRRVSCFTQKAFGPNCIPNQF